MNANRAAWALPLLLLVSFEVARADDPTSQQVRETAVEVPDGPKIKIRMQGPYDAEVPLQIVCYFKHKAAGDTTKGAAITLDEKLGGAIAALRDRGEFGGDEQETLLLDAPEGGIKADRLLLIGVGDEASLSLETMERVGRTALREASRLGAERVAFAPLLRDQGNSSLGVGDVERAVVRGMLLAYDTERRLGKQSLSAPYTLKEWIVEAGPAYFDETVTGVRSGIADATAATKARPAAAYSSR